MVKEGEYSFVNPRLYPTEKFLHVFELDMDEEMSIISFIAHEPYGSYFKTPLSDELGIKKILDIIGDSHSPLVYVQVEDDNAKHHMIVFNGEEMLADPTKRLHSSVQLPEKTQYFVPSHGISETGTAFAIVLDKNHLTTMFYFSAYGPLIDIDAQDHKEETSHILELTII